MAKILKSEEPTTEEIAKIYKEHYDKASERGKALSKAFLEEKNRTRN